MVYVLWLDEGRPGLLGDVGVPAVCPDDCQLGGYCEFCGQWSCPEHGVPEPGEQPDSTHLVEMCVPVSHRLCHAKNCTDIECWVDC